MYIPQSKVIIHISVLFLQVFHNCTCVGEMKSPAMNMSAVLGQCPRKTDCDRIFKIYMALSVTGSFISACGGTPGYIVMLRSETLKLFVTALKCKHQHYVWTASVTLLKAILDCCLFILEAKMLISMSYVIIFG